MCTFNYGNSNTFSGATVAAPASCSVVNSNSAFIADTANAVSVLFCLLPVLMLTGLLGVIALLILAILIKPIMNMESKNRKL